MCIRDRDADWLRAHFGSFGDYLYRAARGIDLRPVRTNRIRKSIGGERTFHEDISDPQDLRDTLERIIDIVWDRIADKQARGRTVTLKLKYNDFQIATRARSVERSVTEKATFAQIARAILDDELPLPLPIRLMGLTLSNLDRDAEVSDRPRDDAQLSLL